MVELARRKGIRGKFTRNRSIALFVAVFAFAVVGLGVVDIGVDIFGGGGFIEGTNFSVEILGNIIPLELVPHLGINCSLWTEGDIVSTDGTRRSIGFDTTVFNPQFSLDVFDPTTNKQLREVDADIKLRCDSPLGLNQDEFVLIGGTISHGWSVENRETGQYTNIGGVFTKSVSPSNIILQTPTGSGVRISGGSIQAAAIDSQSISSEPEYLVELTMNIVGNFIFEQRLGGSAGSQTLTKTVALVSQIGSNAGEFLRVQNEFIDPEPSGSNIVDITETLTIPQPIFKSDPSPQVRICVDAPLYDSTKETRPRIDLYRPVSDGSTSQTKFIDNAGTFGSSGGQRFCTTIDLATSQMFVGNYRVEAEMASRTGTDTSIFTVYEDSQDPMTPIPISPCEGLSGAALIQCANEQAQITPDPCEGLTGPTLDQCLGIAEQFSGCSTGFKEVTNDSFLVIVAEIGTRGTVIIQSGSSTSDDPICLAEETIALAASLAGGGAPSTDICEGLTQEQCEVKLIGEPPTTTTTTTGITCTGGTVAVGSSCVQSCAGLTDAQCSTVIAGCATSTSNTVPECDAILKATQSTTVTVVGSVSEEVKGLILYQIVYDGDDEIGNVSDLETSKVRFNFDPLELAGVPSGKEFYEFARLIVNPVIDITNVAELIQTSNSNPQFTYTWSVAVTRADGSGGTGNQIEKCINNCSILDMKTLGFKVEGDQIQSIESEFRDNTFYHIAQSDIQPNELMAGIETALGIKQSGSTPAESLGKFLKSGDVVKITLDVEGSFEPTITDPTTLSTQKVRASISPMQWSHTFTWIPDFGADSEPCSGLSGQAQIDCEGNPVAKSEQCKDLTPEQCNQELPAKDADGCVIKLIGTSSDNQQRIKLCYGADEEEEEAQSTSSFGSKSDASDTEGKGSIVSFCPAGSSVTECGKIALKILEEKVTGFLGITSSDIQNLSDNALLYVGAVIGFLIVVIILRALFIRWRLRARFRTGF